MSSQSVFGLLMYFFGVAV